MGQTPNAMSGWAQNMTRFDHGLTSERFEEFTVWVRSLKHRMLGRFTSKEGEVFIVVREPDVEVLEQYLNKILTAPEFLKALEQAMDDVERGRTIDNSSGCDPVHLARALASESLANAMESALADVRAGRVKDGKEDLLPEGFSWSRDWSSHDD